MTVTNLEALIFTMGYQGGTIYQCAKDLGVDTADILKADNERMGDLLRMAQEYRNKRYLSKGTLNEDSAIKAMSADICMEDFCLKYGDIVRGMYVQLNYYRTYVDYLRKPVSDAELEAAIHHLEQQIVQGFYYPDIKQLSAVIVAASKQSPPAAQGCQKLREALEKARFALEPYDDEKPRNWVTDRQNLRDAHKAVCQALADHADGTV